MDAVGAEERKDVYVAPIAICVFEGSLSTFLNKDVWINELRASGYIHINVFDLKRIFKNKNNFHPQEHFFHFRSNLHTNTPENVYHICLTHSLSLKTNRNEFSRGKKMIL